MRILWVFLIVFSVADGLAQSTVSAVESWLPATYRMLGDDTQAEGYFLLRSGDDLFWKIHQYIDESGVLHIDFTFKADGIYEIPFCKYLLDREAAIFAPQIDELCPENLLLETGK